MLNDSRDEVWLVLCNTPDNATASKLAAHLMESGAAACVNIMAPCESIYRWEGSIERTSEVPLAIKTSAANYAKVESLICALHPYEVPEIIAMRVVAGLPAYLDWVGEASAR